MFAAYGMVIGGFHIDANTFEAYCRCESPASHEPLSLAGYFLHGRGYGDASAGAFQARRTVYAGPGKVSHASITCNFVLHMDCMHSLAISV